MKILVLGATGPTGREVVSQALDQGHTVTAFVRDRDRLPVKSDRLRVEEGTVDTKEALAAAVAGQDAVISALGVGKSFRSGDLMQRSVPAVIAAMNRHRVRRLIWMSAFGVGDTFRDLPILPRIFARTLLRNLYSDKAAGEEILRSSDLDWTLVYPAGLTNKPRSGKYRAGEHIPLRGFPTIARADVADFMLKQLSDSTYSRKGVLVAN